MNKLLKAYLNKTENREYIRLLFRKPMERLFDLCSTTSAALLAQPQKATTPSLRRKAFGETATGAKLSDAADDPFINARPRQRRDTLYDRVSLPAAIMVKFASEADSKSEVGDEEDEDQEEAFEGVKLRDMYSVCDEIVETVNSQVAFMPLEVRFLCKLVQIHATGIVSLN